MSDGVVRWPARPVTPGRVAVITVSYNTRELTALLLWSLRRMLAWGSLEIVVVDNGSKDGSSDLLAKIDAAGGCRLIANAGNAMHGPALTQAMSFLASRRTGLPQWVWVLDSDIVISKPDALKKAVERAEKTDAAIVGESWRDDEHDMDRFLAYSLGAGAVFSPCGRPTTPLTLTTGGPATIMSRTLLSSKVPAPGTMTC